MKNAPKELSHAACDYFFVVLCIFLTSLMGGSPAAAAESGQAFAMINEARTIARTGNYPEALNKLQEAISLADQNDEKLVMAVAYNNQAEIYRLQGDKVEALESYAQALQIYHEIGHRKGIASTAQKIDTILGRPSRSEPLEPVVTAQSPAMVEEPQEPQVLQPAAPEPSPETPQPEEVTLLTPETLETSPTTALEQPPTEVAPSPTREQLIEEALARVRNRIRQRQAQQAPVEPTAPEVPTAQPPSPSEPSQQSASLRPPPVTKPTDYSAYLEEVKKNIVKAWQYPEQASERGLEGKVDVEFTILENGRLLNVRILESSGYPALDREALRAVGAASPFSPIPKQLDLEQLSIRFTFNYTLESRQGRR